MDDDFDNRECFHTLYIGCEYNYLVLVFSLMASQNIFKNSYQVKFLNFGTVTRQQKMLT